MFEDLFDELSFLMSWKWPVADGEVTAADIERLDRDSGNERLRLSVAYKFSVGLDGPYIGEAYWEPKFSFHLVEKMKEAKKQMFKGKQIQVRYRPSDPSINRMDGGVVRYLGS